MRTMILNQNSHIVEVSEGNDRDFIVVQRELTPEDYEALERGIRVAAGSFHDRVAAAATDLFSEGAWSWMEYSRVTVNKDNEKELYFLSLSLIRRREVENETWVDTYMIPISEEEFKQIRNDPNPELLKHLVLIRLHKYLSNYDGWRKVSESCVDYNWGDSVVGDLGNACGCSDVTVTEKAQVLCRALMVSQDELIAPSDVPVTFVLVNQKKETVLEDGSATLDMQDGTVFTEKEFPDDYSDGYIRFPDGKTVPVCVSSMTAYEV